MFRSPEHSLRALVEFSPSQSRSLVQKAKSSCGIQLLNECSAGRESEVLGTSIPVVPPETRAEFEKDVSKLLGNGKIEGKEVLLQHKEGYRLYVRLWAAPIHNNKGEVVGVTAALEDVTEKRNNERQLQASQEHEREMEAQLQQNEERLRLACDAAKVGCWDWDLVTGEMVWSATASRQMGRPEDAPTGYEIFLNSVHPDDRRAIQDAVEAGIHDNKNPDVPYRVIWPDGSIHWRSVIGRVIHDKTARPVRMLGIGLDLDASKATDDRLLLQAAALQAAANAIVITDKNGVILWTNQAFSELTGYSSEDALSQNPRQLKSGEHDASFYANLWTTIASGNTWHGELHNKRKDGSLYAEEMTITPVRIGGGEITNYIAIKHDITSRKSAESRLRQAEEKYRAIFEDSITGIFQVTLDGQWVSINHSLSQMLGYASPEQIRAEIPCVDQLFVDLPAFRAFELKLARDGVIHKAELEVYCRDGRKRWVSANVRAVTDHGGNMLLQEGTVEDITDRRAAEEQARFLAYYDALTGLPNRALLRDRVQMALQSARRRQEKIALLFLDLDNFKTINDSLGHQAGDLLLREVADRLKKSKREQDTVSRLGGDEFVALVTGIMSTSEAELVAKRIVKSLADEFVIQDHLLNITCSLGISIFPDHSKDVDGLFKIADQAMYNAKENGRNRTQVFMQEMNTEAVEKMTLESGLRRALAKNELHLVYQPMVDLLTGEITGCEALLRVDHSTLGSVRPTRFIPVAENTGLIVPIGEWVLRTACVQAREWHDEGLPARSVAVNISAVQFRRTEFLPFIKTVLHESGLPPHCLELELTERAAVQR